MLHMPSFSDKPEPIIPPHILQQQQQQKQQQQQASTPETPEGVVAHAQYNSPLNVYSDSSMKEQFEIQTGGSMNVQRPGYVVPCK